MPPAPGVVTAAAAAVLLLAGCQILPPEETQPTDLATEPPATAENLAKSDHDPAEWTPRRNKCAYITAWVETKQAYDLTADQAEADAIRTVLADCPGP